MIKAESRNCSLSLSLPLSYFSQYFSLSLHFFTLRTWDLRNHWHLYRHRDSSCALADDVGRTVKCTPQRLCVVFSSSSILVVFFSVSEHTHWWQTQAIVIALHVAASQYSKINIHTIFLRNKTIANHTSDISLYL